MKHLGLITRILVGLGLCTLIALIAGPALSAPSSVALSESVIKKLPQTSEHQVELTQFLAKGEYANALLLWDKALGKTAWMKSAEGIALKAFLKFASGLESEGVDQLLTQNPKKLSPALLKAWREMAPPKHFIWRSADLMNDPAWDNFFSEPKRRRPVYHVDSAKDLKLLARKMSGASSRDEKAWYKWQLALGSSVLNKNEMALALYDQLISEPQGSVGRDQVHMAKGRTLFQMKKFNEAIQAYKEVPQSSDFWMESLEERAWAHVRLESYDQALARLKTLLAPVFAPQVGPEPHFMQALVAVQRCDFPLVFSSFKEFKNAQKPRAKALELLVKNKPSKEQKEAIEKIASAQLDWKSIGSQVRLFPHLFYRDEMLTRNIALFAQSKKEASAAKALKNKAEELGLSSKAFNQILGNSEKRAVSLHQKSLPAVFERLAHLAREDLENVKTLLQKQHVLEAEAIQRMFIFDDVSKQKLSEFKKQKDVLTFPDNGEVWLDELGGYQVKSKGCPTTKISQAQ